MRGLSECLYVELAGTYGMPAADFIAELDDGSVAAIFGTVVADDGGAPIEGEVEYNWQKERKDAERKARTEARKAAEEERLARARAAEAKKAEEEAARKAAEAKLAAEARERADARAAAE